MKKKLFAGILALVLMVTLVCPVQAAFEGYVIDLANEFSDDVRVSLTEKAETISEQYGCAVRGAEVAIRTTLFGNSSIQLSLGSFSVLFVCG